MDTVLPEDSGKRKREDEEFEANKRIKVNALQDTQYVAIPEIRPEELNNLVEIARGSFGFVYRGKCRGFEVAAKELYTKRKSEDGTEEKTIELGEKVIEAFKREVSIMSSFYHPNICLFMGICAQPDRLFIVSEFMPGGDVETLLTSDKDLSLYRRLIMAKEAAQGMSWLHGFNPSFIHRDLKTSNLLLDAKLRVKVCDFGLSQVKNHGQMLRDGGTGPKGTPIYMAPEVLQGQDFNEKADVYAFGIILWEFATRGEPFANHSDYNEFRSAVVNGERPEIPKDCEPSLAALIRSCWAHDHATRPSFQEIVESLNKVIIDICIPGTQGRLFWRQMINSVGHNQERVEVEEVPWTKFWKSLAEFLGIGNTKRMRPAQEKIFQQTEKCVKALLPAELSKFNETRTGEVVTIENFGALVSRFGPMEGSNGEASPDFLDRLRELCKHSWFHGNINTQQAEELLSTHPVGSFLVRFSSFKISWFTVSKVQAPSGKGRIRHYRIQHEHGTGFELELSDAHYTYDTLEDLISDQGLHMPVDGSKFAAIFQEGFSLGGYGNTYDVDQLGGSL